MRSDRQSTSTKGPAVARLVEIHKLTGVIYLGDDQTDVDAFQAIHRLHNSGTPGLAIGVVRPGTPFEVPTNSDWLFPSVGDVEKFLFELISRLSALSENAK